MSTFHPSPEATEVATLALCLGYQERRPEVNNTLFFEQTDPEEGTAPILINIYYTTRSIMTYLNHPTTGPNELWRSNAYENVWELELILQNPRMHTGKGYRNKGNAVRGCTICGIFKKRAEYSKNQWKLGPDVNKCKDCIASNQTSTTIPQGPYRTGRAFLREPIIGRLGRLTFVPPSKPKFITLLNFLQQPYADACEDLKCPSGKKFQRVLIAEDGIEIYRDNLLSGTGLYTKKLPLNEDSFQSIFKQSTQVITHDSMFVQDSFLVANEEFFQYGGMKALLDYFKNGGTINILCVEGIFRIGEVLSNKFGCRWELEDIDSTEVEYTKQGKYLLDIKQESPILLYGKVHFMRSPKGEALISKRVYSEDEYQDEYDPDPDDRDSYRNYRKHEAGQHALCIYEGFRMEGKLIWNGDRGQNPQLKETFEKTLDL